MTRDVKLLGGPRPLFSRTTERPFGPSTCFLCARRLGKRNRADEHVFSNWLLHRCNLHNETITLLNGTRFRYSALTIPCCHDCNNIHLNTNVERFVRPAIEAGAPAVRAVDPLLLHVWLGKTYYGILYKELLLRRNRANPKDRKTITTRSYLREFRMLHYSLQAARVPMVVKTLDPQVRFPLSSHFIFELKQPSAASVPCFTFRDAQKPMCLSLVVGKLGMVACFADGGATRAELGGLMDELDGRALHPHQFVEMEARIYYCASRFRRTPAYLFSEDRRRGAQIMQMPIAGISTRPVFAPWNEREYASVLSEFTRHDVDFLNPRPGALRSFLFNESGEFGDVDI